MRTIIKAAAIAAILVLPVASFAAQTAPTAKKAAATTKAVAKHTTAGVVKSSSDSSLVITKGGKDETFVVNATTEKTGTVDTGAHVTVHYTMDGKNMVATAITATPAKPAAKSKGKK